MKRPMNTTKWGKATAEKRYADGGSVAGRKPFDILDPQAHLDRLAQAQKEAGATKSSQMGETKITVGGKTATSGK